MKMFMVEFFGDLPHTRGLTKPYATYSFDDMLRYLADLFVKSGDEFDEFGISSEFLPDPEDDRIVVWAIVPGEPESVKVVWHFSGWHWQHDAGDLPGGPIDQGTLPGIPESMNLYSVANV